LSRFNVAGFSDGELGFYSRQMVMGAIGLNGQRKLKNAQVCLAGVGGLGSPIAVQLASMGVGRLRLVDMDVVVGVGTAGTGVGASLKLKQFNEDIRVVGVIPELGNAI